jgi:hypothetical protein
MCLWCFWGILTRCHGQREVNRVIFDVIDEFAQKIKIVSYAHVRLSQNPVCEMFYIKKECLPLHISKSLAFLFVTIRTIIANNNVNIVGIIF